MTVAQDRADLDRACAAARVAGDLLLSFWARRGELMIDEKGAGDFVSQADREAEALLRSELCRHGDGWLGEESAAEAASNGRVWIVDPLDGTTNFLRGIGHWAVSIALEVDGVRRIGVIHDPLRDECFHARKGAGAFCNDTPLRVAASPALQGALFGTGIPFGTMAHIDDHAADLARLMPHCAGVRRMGAAALDLAYVGAGRLDGFWERRLQPWDIAAGMVIAREAGAQVEGWHSQAPPEATGSVIAAAPALFDQVAAILRSAVPSTSRA